MTFRGIFFPENFDRSQKGKNIKVNIEKEIIMVTLVVHNLNCLSNCLRKTLLINEFYATGVHTLTL